MTLGVVLLIVSTLVSLTPPWMLKLIIDGFLGDEPVPGFLNRLATALSVSHYKIALLTVLAGGLLLMQLVSALATVYSMYLLVAVGLRMVFRLRCELFGHIQKLSLRFHDSTTVGDSLYRVTWDSYAAQALFNSGLVPALTALVGLAGIGGSMFTRDWLVMLAGLGVGLPLLALVRWMDRPMTSHSMRVQERESEVSTRVQETLSGIRAVQAFGREGFETERFRREAESSLVANLRLTVLQTASQAAVGVLLAAGTALVVWFGCYRGLTAGDVTMMVLYVGMLFKPLESLAYTAASIQGSVAGARRVFHILDQQPGVANAPDAVELSRRAAGQLTFDSVSFEYAPGQPVLKDISLELPAGATVALVGPSGAGKTTLVSLIMRFYDPNRGRILLDGQDLRKIKVESLRQNVSLVLQDPVLFGSTIGENIAYGRASSTPAEIEAAARAAGAHEFISALPLGYETQIGERGVSLSGGQRQRISIARAFLKDAPVLIMDEPTSALDAETEAHLLAAMERLKKGRTTIIIAHRLSTIRNADLIVAMRDGQVIECGSHAELLANPSLYAHLHSMQYGLAADSSEVASEVAR